MSTFFSSFSQGQQFLAICLVLLSAVLLQVEVKEPFYLVVKAKGGKAKPTKSVVIEKELLPLIIDGPADHFANHPAITVDLTSNEKTWSHAQLHADAERVAAMLRQHMPSSSDDGISCNNSTIMGVNHPLRVLLAVSSKTDYHGFVVMLACFKNAYSYVNTAVETTNPQYADIVERLRPPLILVDSITWNRSEMVRDIVSRRPSGSVILAMDDNVPGVPCLFNDNYNLNNQRAYSRETFPLDKEAFIAFTSGSTGSRKMVASSFRQMLRVSSKAQKILGHHPESVLLSLSGFEDTAGYEMLYLPTLLYGSHVLPIVLDGYAMTDITSPVDQEIYTAALDRGVTMLVTTPAMLSFLADVAVEATRTSPVKHNMKTIATFGSKLSATTRRKAARIFMVPSPAESQVTRGPRMVEIYGATEVKIVGSKNAEDTGGGFLLVDGVEARIVPTTITQDEIVSDTARNHSLFSRSTVGGKEVMVEEVGGIFLRSDTYMMGYADQNMASPVDEEGWFCTGDVGYLSEDGKRLTLTDRSRATINYEGEEIDPREILQLWQELLPDVEEMYVLPDNHSANGGQSAVLFALSGKKFEFEKAYDVVLAAYDYFDEGDDFFRNMLVGATHVVCFVDAFPRVGRDKVNLKQVSRAYTKLVTEKKFDKPETCHPYKWNTVFHLEWLTDKQEYRVVEWDDDEW